eukprot:TRINITY_DN27700_c0_g2_i1.p1 TRINITY_DN27700_c0_g2~~TRINITY_DN27700_c0_g2_i1.p1  ORF type:complete len:685 (+),score=158.44 TRINITY_DN27700_c0_g2_i1:160-2214(+)
MLPPPLPPSSSGSAGSGLLPPLQSRRISAGELASRGYPPRSSARSASPLRAGLPPRRSVVTSAPPLLPGREESRSPATSSTSPPDAGRRARSASSRQRASSEKSRPSSKTLPVKDLREGAKAQQAEISQAHSKAQAAAGSFRYVVQFGNNSGLIRQLMRNRPSWAPAPGDPGNSAGAASYQDKRVQIKAGTKGPEINFLWSQYTCRAFHNAMAARQTGLTVSLNEEKTIKFAKQGSGKKEKAGGGSEAAAGVQRCHNHFEGSGLLCTKRGICRSLTSLLLPRGLDPFGAVPLTFIIEDGLRDPSFGLFEKAFHAMAEKEQTIWIVKPGEWGNRGCGIKIYDTFEEVSQRVASKPDKVWAIQKYIERPFLVHKRKFDIRTYCLVVQEPNGGPLQAYHFRDAYLRTTSTPYTVKSLDKMIHLNNDAVQNKGENYGKFESANKLSLEEFQRYLDEHHKKDRLSVREGLMPRIRSLMADAVRSAASGLNPRGLDYCFEVYGFDFMVDASFRPWLIECNANPCLDLCSAYLSHLIPTMLDQALTLTLDRFFQAGSAPGSGATAPNGAEQGFKWDLIFDSASPAAADVATSWLEALPGGTGCEVVDESLAETLGTAILCPKQEKSKKKRKTQEKLSDGAAASTPICGDGSDAHHAGGVGTEAQASLHDEKLEEISNAASVSTAASVQDVC